MRILVLSVILVLIGVPPASAGLITFLDDDREVGFEGYTGFPSVSATVLDSGAPNLGELFEPFSTEIQRSWQFGNGSDGLPVVSYSYLSGLNSHIDQTTMTASGMIEGFLTINPQGHHINQQFILFSRYSIAFEVHAPVDFIINGHVSANENVGAGILLQDETGFIHASAFAANGEVDETLVTGTLTPGRYRMSAVAGVNAGIGTNGFRELTFAADYNFSLNFIPAPGTLAVFLPAIFLTKRRRRS